MSDPLTPRDGNGSHEAEFSRKALSEMDEVKSPIWRVVASKELVIGTTIAAVILYTVSLFISTSYGDQILKALAAFAAGFTFLISYIQWYLARHEISFDKYYDKIPIVNQAISGSELLEKPDKDGQRDHHRNMRVFAQLDNLEYILGKYYPGFVEFDLVDRVIRTFRSECYVDRSDHDIGWFSDKVLFWIGDNEGQQISLGYHAHTRKVARSIVRQVSKELGQTGVQNDGPMAQARKAYVATILAARRAKGK